MCNESDAIDAAVSDAVAMLRRSFADVRAAQEADEIWEGIKHSLTPYRAGRWVHEWYISHQLSACRRAIDRGDGDDVTSIVRGLKILRPIADHLTVDVLERRHGPGPEDGRFEGLAAMNVCALRRAAGEQDERGQVTSGACDSATSVGRDTIDVELALIEELGADIRRLATRMTAHRLDKSKPEVTHEEVRALVAQLAAIYQRWMLVLDAVSIDTKTMHFTVSAAKELARPLNLFDRDEWLAARERLRHILDHADAPPSAYGNVEHLIVARYEVGVRARPPGDGPPKD